MLTNTHKGGKNRVTLSAHGGYETTFLEVGSPAASCQQQRHNGSPSDTQRNVPPKLIGVTGFRKTRRNLTYSFREKENI